MDHTESFALEPPAGPASESLFQASWVPRPQDATARWYAEVDNCGAFPGCKTGSTGLTEHVTAMLWNGAQEIGCTINDHHIVACRYKGGDEHDCRTPNMPEEYGANVFARVRSLLGRRGAGACAAPGARGTEGQGGGGRH